MKRFRVIVIALTALAAVAATFAEAGVAAPNPGVVAGGFCTYGTGYFKSSTEAAQRINQYFGTAGHGKLRTTGSISGSALINPTDMGTGGVLAAQGWR
jgi:hypothetical protein